MQHNLLSTKKTEQLLLKAWGYIYEHNDKAGRFLAQQFKGCSVTQQITQIKNRFNYKLTRKQWNTYLILLTLCNSETTHDSTNMEHF